jgi:hypothetical protein
MTMNDLEAADQIAMNDPFAAAMERDDSVPTETIMDILAAFDSSKVSPYYAESAKRLTTTTQVLTMTPAKNKPKATTTPVWAYDSHEYIASCRYRLDVYTNGKRRHYELHDLAMLDEKGFSQVIFEGSRREDVLAVIDSLSALQVAP